MIYNIEQRTEAWYISRAEKFTGTAIKSLMMGKQTKGYNDAIYNIAAEILTDTPRESKDLNVPAVVNGREREDDARELAADILQMGIVFVEAGFIESTREGVAEWVGISPDGVIFDDETPDIITGIEIKCPEPQTHLKYLSEGKLPKDYFYQVHTAIYVCDCPGWWFMSYHPDLKPFLLYVERDNDVLEKIDAELKEGIKRVKEVLENYAKYEYE